MFTIDTLVLLAELLGVSACAISGVLTAAEKQLDMVGAIIMGSVSAMGGGVLRDLILDVNPPIAFRYPIYLITAMIVSVCFFLIEYFFGDRFMQHREKYDQLLNIFDAIGLAVFVIVGINRAFDMGYADNLFLSVFVGTISGVGGGIIRDTLIGKTPIIFKKRIYCLAAFFGALLNVVMRQAGLDTILSSVTAVILILLIRFLATHYRWNMPHYPRDPAP